MCDYYSKIKELNDKIYELVVDFNIRTQIGINRIEMSEERSLICYRGEYEDGGVEDGYVEIDNTELLKTYTEEEDER